MRLKLALKIVRYVPCILKTPARVGDPRFAALITSEAIAVALVVGLVRRRGRAPRPHEAVRWVERAIVEARSVAYPPVASGNQRLLCG